MVEDIARDLRHRGGQGFDRSARQAMAQRKLADAAPRDHEVGFIANRHTDNGCGFVPFPHDWLPPSSVNLKAAPPPIFPSAHTAPPCRRTTRCTVASPTPVPSKSCDECSRENGKKSFVA